MKKLVPNLAKIAAIALTMSTLGACSGFGPQLARSDTAQDINVQNPGVDLSSTANPDFAPKLAYHNLSTISEDEDLGFDSASTANADLPAEPMNSTALAPNR